MCCLCISAPFAMEINVTKNLVTGETAVVSTATVPAEELKQHAGLKVYDDGRKCVYALNPRQVRSDQQESTLARLVLEQISRKQSQPAANNKAVLCCKS